MVCVGTVNAAILMHAARRVRLRKYACYVPCISCATHILIHMCGTCATHLLVQAVVYRKDKIGDQRNDSRARDRLGHEALLESRGANGAEVLRQSEAVRLCCVRMRMHMHVCMRGHAYLCVHVNMYLWACMCMCAHMCVGERGDATCEGLSFAHSLVCVAHTAKPK